MSDKLSPLTPVMQPGLYGTDTGNPGVVIEERAITSLVQLTLWPGGIAAGNKAVKSVCRLNLPEDFTSPENDACRILPIGPGRYLIDSDDADLETKLRKKLSINVGSVTGLSHARVAIRISGPKATWVLAKGIALDFHIDEFPVGTARATSHHEIGVTIRRIDEEGFDLLVFTSFARAFWHWLSKAAAETGYEVR